MTAVVDAPVLHPTAPTMPTELAVSGALSAADALAPAEALPTTIRVLRIDDWATPGEVPGRLARSVGTGKAREVVALGRWSAARREWAAQIQVQEG